MFEYLPRSRMLSKARWVTEWKSHWIARLTVYRLDFPVFFHPWLAEGCKSLTLFYYRRLCIYPRRLGEYTKSINSWTRTRGIGVCFEKEGISRRDRWTPWPSPRLSFSLEQVRTSRGIQLWFASEFHEHI